MSSDRARPIGVDLFSGVGGFSLGFEQAGFDVVAAVEYDPVHAAVHKFNFPLAKTVCADMHDLTSSSVELAVRDGLIRHGRPSSDFENGIDVVFGGPPCQGFSHMGKRAFDDPRNVLVFRFLKMIAELRPRYFVMENVPGMQSGGHASILTDLVKQFEAIGYHVSQPHRILNAADFGVPQDRKRLILWGRLPGSAVLHYPSASVSRVPKRSNGAREVPLLTDLPIGPSVWEAIGDLPDLDEFEELVNSDEVKLSALHLATLEKSGSHYVKMLRGVVDDPSDRAYPRLWDRTLLTSSRRTTHTSDSIHRFGKTDPGSTEAISRFYRLEASGLSNTLRAGSGTERGAFTSPRPLHPKLPRVISVREAARLHGFPDWFRFHSTKWNGFRSIGNAVPPPLAKHIASAVARALRIDAVRPLRQVELGDKALLSLNRLEAARHFNANLQSIPSSRLHHNERVAG